MSALTQIVLDTVTTVPAVLPYLSDDARMFVELRTRRATKAEGDLTAISAEYHDRITAALITFMEGGSVTGPRNSLRKAAVEELGGAFDLGWVDGGQDLPPDADALDWLNARIEQEMSYIGMMFEEAKALRKEEDFDPLPWINERADGYTRTLREMYNSGKLRAEKDKMVTFTGDDGEESCMDCQKLKGKRHKISWFVARNYIPPFGTGLECHPGRRCQHYLEDDAGHQVTV